MIKHLDKTFAKEFLERYERLPVEVVAMRLVEATSVIIGLMVALDCIHDDGEKEPPYNTPQYDEADKFIDGLLSAKEGN